MPDARVQAAIDHWAPRFVQAGVDYSDFVVTTAGVERWEDWHAAWCRNGDMHAGLAEEAASKDRRLTAGEAWSRATVAYHFAKFVWMVDRELSRAAADKAVAAMAKTHEYLDPGAERIEVPLDGGMATLSMDGPGQGECGYDLPIRPDYDVAVSAVLDSLGGRTDVDLDRVGLLGVSLGG